MLQITNNMLWVTEKYKKPATFQIYMTTLEEHRKIVKELEEDINEKIRAGLLCSRQKIIGFATSEAAANMFAFFLHKINLISPGAHINHRHFASIQIALKQYAFDFPKKKKILNLLTKQEELREKLCYGKDKEAKISEDAVANFYKLKKCILDELGEKYDK
ncbi:MAG: hypothetical protein ABIB71_04880 [Candidatus Woesearchaeota archaeon]